MMRVDREVKVKEIYKYAGRWFWGIIIFGALLPLIVEIIIKIIFDPKNFSNFFLSITASFFLVALFNAIPFIIWAFLVKSLWHRPENEIYQGFYKHKAGVIGSGILTIGFVLYVNIGIWLGIILHQPGASTSAIAYIILPFYGIMTNLFGYGLGRLIGKIILAYKKDKGSGLESGK
jgi:hypothetical protein